MLARRIYYVLKPIIPWSVRMAIRQRRGRHILMRSEKVWPIDESAGSVPPGWPGWPDGKQFALVLTHDVEGCKGCDRVRQLMELEIRLGFHSSFNFVPEGTYRVSATLREELASKGFEIGVHDLNHDGKLYNSHKNFLQKAARINGYLENWNAVGFRSAFMLHNLEWLQQLNVLYDASTFDTDPFEPQPEGVGTIFPFWVLPQEEASATSSFDAGRNGYVELPYSLVQDSTLFFVLGEGSIDIWKKKLDWIVQRGGMALLNVHPDYINFSTEHRTADEFPSRYYREFLTYIRDKYEGSYWHALPRDVAEWYRQLSSFGAERSSHF